ncbi:hypothetical protein HIM_05048 [Hirsutella minnesotensis 3608]|uniref:Aminoglycoside phosphotransferase domain-containing protein n=1 Tax=Hirsutella minnesotensis 3608 TaxID=1043627 RepID=A0A0F7ZPJ0_9HYPO|nr:hypothetical protein HIM_05048 [Hirsutella minnesotensis 3608]
MLFTICHCLLVQWRWCVKRAHKTWKGLLALVTRRFTWRPNLLVLNPLTAEQLDSRADEFVKSIDVEAVRDLASSYNDGAPCRIDVTETARGSFNVCFFARFAHQVLVVRVPIQPVVHDAWGKLRSEVCTMLYIQENTRIPIPRVRAYGQAGLLHGHDTEQAFMILDYVDGHPLVEKHLLSSSKQDRCRLFSELIDILAQLRQLEFSTGGSLMPGLAQGSSSRPAVTGVLSIPLNDLRIQGYSFLPSPPKSTDEYVSQQRHLLRDYFQLPAPALDQKTAELELFALHTIDQLSGVLNHEREPFVLSHTDLRCSNIMVDDELHIVGIIDWEWAATVPTSLFIPPSWVTRSEDLFLEFSSVLSSKHASSLHSQLVKEWGSQHATASRVAEILQKPHQLVSVFYRFIYPRLYTRPREEVVSEYFLCGRKQRELLGLLRNSERYTRYLKENNLFIEDDEETRQAQEWLAKVQAFYDGKETL